MSIEKKNETRIAKLFQTVTDLINPDNKNKEIVLPESMTANELKSYVGRLIKEAQPRHLRKEGRTSLKLEDYKMPVNFFIVESNTVPFIAGRGSVYFGPNGASTIDEMEEERERREREEEEEEVLLEMDNPEITFTITGGVDGVEAEEEKKKTKQPYIRKQTRERVDVIITNEDSNMKMNVSNPAVNQQLTSRDYGELIINHVFWQGRKTIDELIKELPAIEKHLMTLLVNKLVTDGYLTLKDDVDITYDDETGEEKERKEVRTLEIVPIKESKKLEVKEDGSKDVKSE